MTHELDVVAAMTQGWPVILLLAWAELRALPRLADAIGYLRAVAEATGATEARAAELRPDARLLRRAGGGGTALLALTLLLGGCCGASVEQGARELRAAAEVYSRASSPREGVDGETWAELDHELRRLAAELERRAGQ